MVQVGRPCIGGQPGAKAGVCSSFGAPGGRTDGCHPDSPMHPISNGCNIVVGSIETSDPRRVSEGMLSGAVRRRLEPVGEADR
jgi:hypothetical protein